MARYLIYTIIIVLVFTSSFATAIEKNTPHISDKATESASSTTIREQTLPAEQSTETQAPWWLKILIEVVGICAGIGIIVWQISKQHRNTLNIQKENFKEKLRLEIYQELIKHVDNTSTKLSSQIAKSTNLPISLETYRASVATGSSGILPRGRAEHFSENHHSLNDSVNSIV